MKVTKIYSPIAALLLTGAVFTACSSDDATTPVASGNWKLELQASKPEQDTRVLDFTEGLIGSKWEQGVDKVEVYKVGEDQRRGYLVPTSSGSTDTKLATDENGLAGSFAAGDNLLLIYRHAKPDYRGQKGTLADISDNYDYSTSTLTIASVDPATQKLVPSQALATFNNLQCIVRFELKYDNEDLAVKTLNVSALNGQGEEQIIQYYRNVNTDAVQGSLDVELDEANSEVWVAISHMTNGYFNLTATTETGQVFRAVSTTSLTLIDGKFYVLEVPMTPVE